MLGRLTIEAIHLIGTLMEYYRDRKKNLHMLFKDLEKAYDKVLREVLWHYLQTKEVPYVLMLVIKDTYSGVTICARMLGGTWDTSQ